MAVHPYTAFLAAAHAAGRARQAEKLGIHAQVDVDFPAVMQRVRSIRDSFNQGVGKRLEDAGVKIVFAEASFTGERIVTGGEVTVQAPIVVINTGTSSLIPNIPGLAETPYLTNRNFFDLQTLPPRLLVIGGGYIGLELGQGLARLGSQTQIIVRGDRVLDREESEVGKMAKAFERDSIGLHCNTEVKQVAYTDGVFRLTHNHGEVQGEALLVATGRKPNTQALNVGATKVELDDRGYIKIDDRFHTTCDGVYAIGDAAGQPAFTHVSKGRLSPLEGDFKWRGSHTQRSRARLRCLHRTPSRTSRDDT